MIEFSFAAHWVATGVCWAAVATGLRYGWMWRIPVFMVYLISQGVYWLFWSPGSKQYLAVEPAMLIMRFLVLMELFYFVSFWTKAKERRWAALLLLAIVALILFKTRSLFVGDDPLEVFRSIRKLSGLSLASLSSFGMLIYWIKPVSLPGWVCSHARLVTAYFLLKAIVELFPRQIWWTSEAVFFMGATTCLGLWIESFQRMPLHVKNTLLY